MTKSYLLCYNSITKDAEVIHISELLTESERKKAEEFLKRMKGLLVTGEYTIRPSWEKHRV